MTAYLDVAGHGRSQLELKGGTLQVVNIHLRLEEAPGSGSYGLDLSGTVPDCLLTSSWKE